MADLNLSVILQATIAGFLSFIASVALLYLSYRWRLKAILFELDFKKIYEFLDTPGLKDLIKFFNKKDPSEIMTHFENMASLNYQLVEQRENLRTISALLASRLFNETTGRIHKRIEENALLISRLEENKQSKLYLRDYFTQLLPIKKILRYEKSIFIESGSTLAYAILPIIDNLRDLRPDCDHNPLIICTNNVIIYMILLFEEFIEPILLPGKPNNGYGATFGDPNKSDTCNTQVVKDFLEDNKVTTLFTTGSFLDIEYGPHVSSRPNHTIKKVLNDYANENNKTNIFVITTEKINSDVSNKKIKDDCKLIFDFECSDKIAANPHALELAQRQWKEHLNKPNNMIITGTTLRTVCTDVTATFSREHETLHPFKFDFGEGCMMCFSRKEG